MVCKKLQKGNCKTTKRTCRAKYMVKMKHYKNCKNYKTGIVTKKKVKKKSKKRR